MKAQQFNSLEDLLNHLGTVIKEAEAAEATQPPACECDEIDDFELRRHVISYVVDKISFNTPEQFQQYVEFVYGFMAEGATE